MQYTFLSTYMSEKGRQQCKGWRLMSATKNRPHIPIYVLTKWQPAFMLECCKNQHIVLLTNGCDPIILFYRNVIYCRFAFHSIYLEILQTTILLILHYFWVYLWTGSIQQAIIVSSKEINKNVGMCKFNWIEKYFYFLSSGPEIGFLEPILH